MCRPIHSHYGKYGIQYQCVDQSFHKWNIEVDVYISLLTKMNKIANMLTKSVHIWNIELVDQSVHI